MLARGNRRSYIEQKRKSDDHRGRRAFNLFLLRHLAQDLIPNFFVLAQNIDSEIEDGEVVDDLEKDGEAVDEVQQKGGDDNDDDEEEDDGYDSDSFDWSLE